MRILLGVAVCMMHAMHNRISPRIQKGSPLEKPRTEIEKLLPERIRIEHLMRSIPVKEKCLEKQGYKPVYQKKIYYYHDLLFKTQIAQR